MKTQQTAELPKNYYGWNGITIEYIKQPTDTQAANTHLPYWWIFDDNTLRDFAAQANALLSEHAERTVGPVHFPNREVAIPAPAQVWEVTFLEKQGETENGSSRFVFGTRGQVEEWANAELLNYYGAVDDMDDDDESDDDEPELDEDGWIDDGWVRKATISGIDAKPTIEIVNLCGPAFIVDLNHPQYTAIPGPYDYMKETPA